MEMNRRRFVTNLIPAFIVLPGTVKLTSSVAERLQDLGDSSLALDDDDFWKRVRTEFLFNPGVSHLNCGTLGATPRVVLDAISSALYEIEGNPAANVFGPVGARMNEVQRKAEAFLGADEGEIALTRNTTEGMNMVADGIEFKPGDEILMTNHEHHGGFVGWEQAERVKGAKIVQMKMPVPVRDRAQILSLVRDHITDRTRVCSFSHVSTITGLQMPLEEIAAITRPRGILLVADGAQAPGMLSVDVKALGVDTYASSSHKWMLASKGSGLLYIRKEVQDRIRPTFLSYGFAPYTASSGTRNVAQILGHGVAMDFHNKIGKEKIEARCRKLNMMLRNRLSRLKGLRIITPASDDLATGIVSISLDGARNGAVAMALKNEGIIVKVIPMPDYNGLRFSTHIYNSEADLDRLTTRLAALL